MLPRAKPARTSLARYNHPAGQHDFTFLTGPPVSNAFVRAVEAGPPGTAYDNRLSRGDYTDDDGRYDIGEWTTTPEAFVAFPASTGGTSRRRRLVTVRAGEMAMVDLERGRHSSLPGLRASRLIADPGVSEG